MTSTLIPLFGPVPGGIEMVVILLIAVLLFGANKIPKLARSTGQAMGEFKKGRTQVEKELEEFEEGADLETDTGTGDGEDGRDVESETDTDSKSD